MSSLRADFRSSSLLGPEPPAHSLAVRDMQEKFGDFPGGTVVKNLTFQCLRHRFHPWVGKIPWRRKWQSTPVFLPGKFHGQRNLEGHGVTERLGHDLELNNIKQTSLIIL